MDVKGWGKGKIWRRKVRQGKGHTYMIFLTQLGGRSVCRSAANNEIEECGETKRKTVSLCAIRMNVTGK